MNEMLIGLTLIVLLFLVTACGEELAEDNNVEKVAPDVSDTELKETSLTVGDVRYSFFSVSLTPDSYGKNAAVPVAYSIVSVNVIATNLKDGLVIPDYYTKFILKDSEGKVIDKYNTDKKYYEIDAAYIGFILLHQIKSINAGSVGHNAYYKTKETKEKLGKGKEKYTLVLEFYNPQNDELLGSMEKEIMMGKGAPQVQQGKNKVQFDLSYAVDNFESNGVLFSLAPAMREFKNKKVLRSIIEMKKIGEIDLYNEKERFVAVTYLLDENNNLLTYSFDKEIYAGLYDLNSKEGRDVAKEDSELFSFNVEPGKYKVALAVFERDPVKVEALNKAQGDQKKIKRNSPPIKSGKPYKILVKDIEYEN